MSRYLTNSCKNGDGYITSSELRREMERQGKKVTKSQANKLIKDADKNHDGKISYKEFFDSLLKR